MRPRIGAWYTNFRKRSNRSSTSYATNRLYSRATNSLYIIWSCFTVKYQLKRRYPTIADHVPDHRCRLSCRIAGKFDEKFESVNYLIDFLSSFFLVHFYLSFFMIHFYLSFFYDSFLPFFYLFQYIGEL